MSLAERTFEAVLDQVVGPVRLAKQRPSVSAKRRDMRQELGPADHAAAPRLSAVPDPAHDIRRPRLDARDGPADRPVTSVNAPPGALFRTDRIFLADPVRGACICCRIFPTRKLPAGEKTR